MYLYKYVLSFHIIAVISWMAGILYTFGFLFTTWPKQRTS